MDISGKVALVTGGARGLGKAFSEAMLEKGAFVCIADIDVKQGIDTVNELRDKFGLGTVQFIGCDVTDPNDLKRLMKTVRETYRRLDILVNNAGVGEEIELEKLIAINVTGLIRLSMLGADYMSTSNGGKGGVIINIGSTSGLTGVSVIPNYSATKHAVVGYSRSLGAALQSQGVRVVCLCPSFTETEMFNGSAEEKSPGQGDQERNNPSTVGVMKIPEVVAAFTKLLEDEDNHGGVMAVTPKGMTYKFPRRLAARL